MKRRRLAAMVLASLLLLSACGAKMPEDAPTVQAHEPAQGSAPGDCLNRNGLPGFFLSVFTKNSQNISKMFKNECPNFQNYVIIDKT